MSIWIPLTFFFNRGGILKVMRYILTFAFLILPVLAEAASSVQKAVPSILKFFNTSVIPFLIGIGFIFFVINVVRYFIIGGTTDDGKKKAKNLAIYSVAALVSLTIFWGLVNVIANSLGLGYEKAPTLDYMEEYRRR